MPEPSNQRRPTVSWKGLRGAVQKTYIDPIDRKKQHNRYLRMRKDALWRECEMRSLHNRGKKEEVIERILDYEELQAADAAQAQKDSHKHLDDSDESMGDGSENSDVMESIEVPVEGSRRPINTSVSSFVMTRPFASSESPTHEEASFWDVAINQTQEKLKFSTARLRHMCKLEGLSIHGGRFELIGRLVDKIVVLGSPTPSPTTAQYRATTEADKDMNQGLDEQGSEDENEAEASSEESEEE